MFEIVLLILPGFASLYYVISSKKIKAPESNQWILLPLLAFYSLVSLFISFTVIQLVWFLFQMKISFFYKGFTSFDIGLKFFDKTISIITVVEYIISFVIAYFLPKCKNFFSEFTKHPEIFEFLEKVHAKPEESPIMIDLKDKRTYIGFLVSADKWSNNHNTIQLKSMISCYRTDGKLKVHSLFMIKDENGHFVEEFNENQKILFMLNEISSIRKIDMKRFFIHLVSYDFDAEGSVYKKLGIPEKAQQ